ncbi:MAG: DUF2029 domain-containing protein [Chloroflexi bacterium]|nr:DUF2029 domain-containing protein [Chloroflexota bacterium]
MRAEAPIQNSTARALPGASATALGRFRAAGASVLHVLLGGHPWPASGPWGRVGQVLLLAAALAYVLAEAPSGGFGPLSDRFAGNDLVPYLGAARTVADGDVRQLYDPVRQQAAQAALLGPLGLQPKGMEFVNPPLWAAVLVPLLPLGLYAADFLWRLLLVLGSGAALLRASPAKAARPAWLLLLFFPFIQAVHHRSMVVVLLAAFTGWVLLARAGKPGAAGLVISLLLLKPQYAVVPFLLLLGRREWRQISGFAVGAALQAVLTVALLMAGGGAPGVDAILPFVGFGGDNSGAMVETHVNLRALIARFGTDLSGWGPYVLLGIGTLASLAVLLVLLPRNLLANDWSVLAVAAGTNLLAPYNQVTGLTLLLVPAIGLLLTRSTAKPVGMDSARFRGAGGRRTPFHTMKRDVLSTDPRVAALAVALALPSLGILLAPLAESWYLVGAWASVVTALVLGLAGSRSSRPAPLRGPA